MAKLTLTGVPGTDTESEFELRVDGALINHTLITRARFYLVGSTAALDSQAHPAAWSFASAGKLVVRLGRGDLVTGRYRGRLITHDVEHANGLMWDNEINITML